ncbi:MAG: response regulator [Gammaproteobacteria bacterium]|nr:response regulator [Gammaproteobacteria bacterium]MDH5776883.1 response regulator [Gammaproteobacteria bacterium]
MKKLTALIADDSLSARTFLRDALQQAGISVTETKNGDEAWLLTRQHQYDLILTDLYLPRLSGIELTSKLRAQTEYASTPILAVSNNKASIKKDAIKNAGASGMIRLPIKIDELHTVLKKLLPI